MAVASRLFGNAVACGPCRYPCSFSRIGRACSCRSRCIRERLTVSREAGLHSPPLREERLVPVGRDRSRPARRVEPGDLLRRTTERVLTGGAGAGGAAGVGSVPTGPSGEVIIAPSYNSPQVGPIPAF